MNGVNNYFAWKMAVEQAQFFGLFLGIAVVLIVGAWQWTVEKLKAFFERAGVIFHKRAQYSREKQDFVIQLFILKDNKWVFHKYLDDASWWERMRAF